jgi:hypothetical protein
LIDQFDQVLKNRDSVPVVKDYRGLSLPAWQAAVITPAAPRR